MLVIRSRFGRDPQVRSTSSGLAAARTRSDTRHDELTCWSRPSLSCAQEKAEQGWISLPVVAGSAGNVPPIVNGSAYDATSFADELQKMMRRAPHPRSSQ